LVVQLKHYAGAGEVLRDGVHFCWVQYSLRLDQEPEDSEPKMSGEVTISTDEQLAGEVFKMEASREYTLVLADKTTSRRVTLVSDDPVRGVWQLIFHPGQLPP
jgi:hypothetical protein